MQEIIEKAKEFARKAHEGIDQRRKFTGEPYIVHPERVAEIVASVVSDEVTIAAAWLHDVVEDTPVTIEEIIEVFGSDVAVLVSNLTKVTAGLNLNREDSARINREHIANIDSRAKTVKLADIIHNLSDVVLHDPEFAKVYVGEKELLLDVLTDGNHVLYRRAEQLIKKLSKTLF